MATPFVKLLGPTTVVIGRICTFELVVTVSTPTRIERITAGLLGRQGWETSASSQHVTVPNSTVDLAGRRVLPVGSHRFPVQFEVPRTTAPTHRVHPAYGWLQVIVKIERPWWRSDSLYAWNLAARLPPPTQVIRKHATIGTAPAKPTDPRIEVALASSVLVAGETMRGACAVFHVDDREPREIELSLVAMVALGAAPHSAFVDGPVHGKRKLVVAAGGAGTTVPFAIPLSYATCPSFTAPTHAVSWQLRVRSGSFFAGKAEAGIPLEILDPAAAAIAPPMGPVPRLGDDRIGALFAAFADRTGWYDAYVTDDASIMIEREVGDSALQLAYAYRGSAGTQLIARVVHPSLGLGLSVTPASLVRHAFSRDLKIDEPEWDRAHHVTARSEAQTIPMLKPSADAVTRATGVLGMFMSWTDEAITFEVAITKLEDGDLVLAGRALESLAVALAETRSLVTPPLPVDLAAYRALGRLLSAPIVVGDLSITGKLGAVPVAVGLAWSGDQPTGVRVSAGNPDATSEIVRQISIALATADHARANPRDDVPDAVRDRLAAWPVGVIDVRIADGVVSVMLPLDGGFDVARVRELVQWSSAIVAALDPGAGPYR